MDKRLRDMEDIPGSYLRELDGEHVVVIPLDADHVDNTDNALACEICGAEFEEVGAKAKEPFPTDLQFGFGIDDQVLESVIEQIPGLIKIPLFSKKAVEKFKGPYLSYKVPTVNKWNPFKSERIIPLYLIKKNVTEKMNFATGVLFRLKMTPERAKGKPKKGKPLPPSEGDIEIVQLKQVKTGKTNKKTKKEVYKIETVVWQFTPAASVGGAWSKSDDGTHHKYECKAAKKTTSTKLVAKQLVLGKLYTPTSVLSKSTKDIPEVLNWLMNMPYTAEEIAEMDKTIAAEEASNVAQATEVAKINSDAANQQVAENSTTKAAAAPAPVPT